MDLKFEKLLNAVEELRSRMDKKSRDYNNLKHCFDELKSRYEKTDKHCVLGDNDREQYSRNWCLRFFGIYVKQEDIDESAIVATDKDKMKKDKKQDKDLYLNLILYRILFPSFTSFHGSYNTMDIM